jgi:S1-C subfamily serine protease
VVGIATSALSRSYGVVVPATTVSRVVAAILSKGHVARAFLGIGAQSVPLGNTEPEGSGAQSGLLVTHLVPHGPADRAGILVGDILVSVNGGPATSLQDLRHGLADEIGRAVKVEVRRGGAPAELTLTVGQWPTESRCC